MKPAAITIAPLVERQSLREQIANALRAAVVSGEMRPGVLYSVPSLAAQFQVSATPVREAMLDLTKEGLVESVRNKGFRVTEVTDDQLDEITELRALIEVPTVARLAESIEPAQVAELRPLAEQICEAADAGDLIGYIDADRQFHLALLELGGNRRLVEVVSELRGQTRLYGLSKLVREQRLIKSAEEHLEILDALGANDRERCEEVMRRHIRHVRGLWAPRGED
ncbi:MAG TPA: GntR family transcriptional regulator [Solirubrobacteraceae bacterium]|nr:GntR family transcriptional regulator [Solirubrobacteraceae bacterium]